MPSFGQELRRERELRGIGLREVAEATKVNIRYLEAMERDEFDHLPGGVFNRGFVRAYAQYIGVDPDAMVNAYLMEEQAQGDRHASTPETLMRGRRSGKVGLGNEPPGAEARPARPFLRWSLVGLLILVIVLAVVVLATMFSDTWAGAGGPTRTEAGWERSLE